MSVKSSSSCSDISIEELQARTPGNYLIKQKMNKQKKLYDFETNPNLFKNKIN